VFWFGVAEYFLAMVLAASSARMLDGEWGSIRPGSLIPGDTTEKRDHAFWAGLDWAFRARLEFQAISCPFAARCTKLNLTLIAVGVVAVLALAGRPLRYGLSLAALVAGVEIYNRGNDPLLFEGRGFFRLRQGAREP